jgi:hypothetical protein
MNFKNALVKTLILAILLFQGCSKKDSAPDEPEEKPLPLAKLKSVRPSSGPGGVDYYYNNNGRIDKVETRSGNDLISVYDFVYKDGLVWSLNASAPPPARWKDPLDLSFKHVFKYSGTQVVEILIEVLGAERTSDNSRHTFSYDSRGFIKARKWEYIRFDGKIELFRIDRMTTDDKGNVTRTERDYYQNDILLSTLVELREYDNKASPYYKLITPANVEEYFSPNNRIKTTVIDRAGNLFPSFYEYEYNAEGLPVKMTTETATATFGVLFAYYK